jgi:cytochrome c biogenesis protein CcmG/thiol:disulfide interchange protein DsbE
MLDKGQQAPDFELMSMDGSRHTLTKVLVRGPVVLAFFKVSCPVCRFALPFVERLAQAPSHSDLLFYGISQDDTTNTKRFLEQQGIHFPTLLDPAEGGFAVSNAYGIRTVPSVFLIEPDSTISVAFSGFERAGLEEIGNRVGHTPFKPEEQVPAFQPG